MLALGLEPIFTFKLTRFWKARLFWPQVKKRSAKLVCDYLSSILLLIYLGAIDKQTVLTTKGTL